MAEKKVWKVKDQTSIEQQGLDLGTGSSNRADKFVQQNSPLNNELVRNESLKDLYGDEETKRMTDVQVRGAVGKRPPVYTPCRFYFDAKVDLTQLNAHGRFEVAPVDRRAHNAICTLWLNGRRRASMSEVYAIMYGYKQTHPSPDQLQKAKQALIKCSNVWIEARITDELNSKVIRNRDALIQAGILKSRSDKLKCVTIKDTLLHLRFVETVSEQGNVTETVEILAMPALLAYNLAKNTLISIPMDYIGLTSVKATDKSIAIQDYLLMRILSYQAGSLRENKILYDTIYRDSGLERPTNRTEFARDRKMIAAMLSEWQSKGLLISSKEVKKGRSYVGIEFETVTKNAAKAITGGGKEGKETESGAEKEAHT